MRKTVLRHRFALTIGNLGFNITRLWNWK